MTLQLQDRICQFCGKPFERHGWTDKRQYCPDCLIIKHRRYSKLYANIKFVRWIPEQLKDKIRDIEEEL